MLLTARVEVAWTLDDPLCLAQRTLQLLRECTFSNQHSSLKISVAARDNSRFMTHVKAIAASQPGAR